MTCNKNFQKLPSAYQEDLLGFDFSNLPNPQTILRTQCLQALRQMPPVIDGLTEQAALLVWGGHARGTSIDNHDIDLLSMWTSLPSHTVIGHNGINHQKTWESDGQVFDLSSKETSDVLGSILKGNINWVELVYFPRWCYFQVDEKLYQFFQTIKSNPLAYISRSGLLNSSFGFNHAVQKEISNPNKAVTDYLFFKKSAIALFYLKLAQNIVEKNPAPFDSINRKKIIQIKQGRFSRQEVLNTVTKQAEFIQGYIDRLPENKLEERTEECENLILEFAKYQLSKYNAISARI